MERKRSMRRRVIPVEKPPLSQRAKDHCRSFTAFLFSNIGIIILVVLYMTAGAVMFTYIEKDEAVERWAELPKARTALANQLWNVSSFELNGLNKTVFTNEVSKKLFDYQVSIVKAVRSGWPGGDESGKGRKQWTFSGALLYSLTVITTIGYGNLAPRTQWGKVATVLYAIIGMPLFLLYLSNIGDVLAKSFKWIYAKVCLCRICPGVAKRRAKRERSKVAQLDQPYRSDEDFEASLASTVSSSSIVTESDEEDVDVGIDSSANTVTVPLTVCLMIIIGYIVIGAIMFGRWENWRSLDGCYFCFISLSSIGFGDIVPGDKIMQEKQKKGVVDLRFIVCAVYLLLGMALIAMCFNLMQEQVIHKMRSFKRGLRRCFRCDR